MMIRDHGSTLLFTRMRSVVIRQSYFTPAAPGPPEESPERKMLNVLPSRVPVCRASALVGGSVARKRPAQMLSVVELDALRAMLDRWTALVIPGGLPPPAGFPPTKKTRLLRQKRREPGPPTTNTNLAEVYVDALVVEDAKRHAPSSGRDGFPRPPR